jgi:predicted alpha/beta-fold hydrolase
MPGSTAPPAPFLAPRFLRTRHVQSLFTALPLYAPPRTFPDLAASSVRMPIPGGGALHGEAWWHAEGERLAVILIHGVGGSTESRYLVRAAVALYRAGYHVVRLNLRGAGGSIADAPTLYHAGLTEDPRVAIDATLAMERVRGVVVVGFSLGGNVVLKLAGEWKDAVPRGVRGMAAVSAPLDLAAVSRGIERKRSLMYRAYILRSLVRQGLEFARLHRERARYDVRRVAKLRSIRAYDDVVVAPMHGFAGVDDYYARASCGPFLPDVRVPTLLVHADDDPIVPGRSVEPWLARASTSVRVAWSKRGGHVGWFAGMTEERWVNTWAVARLVEFLRARDDDDDARGG